jgi:hypothetical protein
MRLRVIRKIQKVLQVFLNLNLNLNLAILKMRIAPITGGLIELYFNGLYVIGKMA